MYCYGTRYYDPGASRFLSRDTYDGTAQNPITQNHYAYANSNPLSYIDPSGHMSMAGSIGVLTGIRILAGRALSMGPAIARGAIATSTRAATRGLIRGATLEGGFTGLGQLSYVYTLARLYARLVASESDAPNMVPIQVYGSNNLAEHQNHIADSMLGLGSNYRPTPALLTKGSTPGKNARSFLKRKSACGRQPRGNKACDEYPYASTIQGGKANFEIGNVSTRLVSASESSTQGGLIRTSNRISPINEGDNFLVIPLGGISGFFDKKGFWHVF